MTEIEEDENNATTKTNNKITDLISSLKNVFLAEHIYGIYRFSIRGNQLYPPTWINKLYALCLLVFNVSVYTYFLDLDIAKGELSRIVDVLDELSSAVT